MSKQQETGHDSRTLLEVSGVSPPATCGRNRGHELPSARTKLLNGNREPDASSKLSRPWSPFSHVDLIYDHQQSVRRLGCVMLSSSSSRFDSMLAQPPTPPKEISKAVDDAISFLDDSHEIERALSKSLVQRRPSLQAAVPSPAPSQESTSTLLSKKVGFSPHDIFHQPPDRVGSPARRVVGRSPSARGTKPLKSILKSTHALPLTPDDLDSKLSYFSPDVPGSFAKMLQSVLNQLASDSMSNRLDAYMTLNGALQAYSDVPDAATLTQKLGILTQFLSRDIAWKTSDGKLNTNIVVQALKLTNFLLFNDSIAAALDTDFRCFLVDRSIAVMESTEIPKQIMKAHIHLLAQPKLQCPAMSASRADRILNALQTVDKRCSGNNVISTRLIIYQRLLEQAPTLMLTRIRDWLEQTFHGMLSSISDVRGRAIDTCTKGGVRIGTQALAAKGVSEFLDTEIEEGQTYYEYFSTKLLEMLSDKESAACVPRIWAALTLYFRNKRKPLEKWTRFRNWLTIIQKCLNSSDIAVRYEATLAWNKLVYTMTFDASPSPGMMNMLKTPIISGIERRGQDPFSKQIRQYTMDCYCNLLHYGLRPSLGSEEIEAGWRAFVDPILIPMTKASQKGRMTACRILYGLMSGSGGVWNGNAALVPTPIKPEDLPRLEPRWIRSHLANVLAILQPGVQASLWLSPEVNLGLESAWAALMQTVADAGAQEVKTSSDLKQAVALLVGFFRQLWNSKPEAPSDSDPQRWQSNYVSMVETMVTRLGPGHFIEGYLTTSESDVVEVAPTPSTKRSKHLSTPQAPMVIMLRPFFASSSVVFDRKANSLFKAGSLLDRFVLSRPSLLAKLDTLSRVFFALRSSLPNPCETDEDMHLWETCANSAISILSSEGSNEQQQPGSLGQSLRHAMDILSAGLEIRSQAGPGVSIQQFYDAVYVLAKDSAGDGGIVIAALEPTCKALSNAGPALSLARRLHLTVHILSKAVWPRNRQAIENARKALWGVGLAPHKANLFDPFDHVYSSIVDALTSIYAHFDNGDTVDLGMGRQLMPAVVSFLESAPVSLLLTGLRRTQEGFAVWVHDEEKKTSLQAGSSDEIKSTWTALLALIKRIPSSDSNLLKSLEILLVAGFASPHRQVVNETILFWNAKFGGQRSLEYPPKLESVLRARMVNADIELPAFPDSNIEHVPATLPDFFETESRDTNTISAQGPASGLQPHQQWATCELKPEQSEYFTAQKSPAVNVTTIPNTVDRRSAASGSSTPKARLRHDDSQIQFALIDSSPIRFEDDSQHFTEHQKEVKARQNETAQMFPELSSSPMAQSTALLRPLSKRLDFSSEARLTDEDEVGTPTALPDATGLMSDDLPSSPTPSSTKDAGQAVLDLDDDQATEDELDEPPSSPPRGQDDGQTRIPPLAARYQTVGPDDMTVGVTGFSLQNDEDVTAPGPAMPVHATETPAERDNLPSDSILPTEQLQFEAEAAEMVDETLNGKGDALAVPTQVSSKESKVSRADDIHRVEDSFVGNANSDTADKENAGDSPSSRRSTRKRKRSLSVVSTTKKQKSASPFKRFISRIWPASQQDDEDIGEEIVVASSQRSQSPDSPRVPLSTADPSQQGHISQAVGEPATDMAEIKGETMAPPAKRRPGRPRKSATPTPSISSQTNENAFQPKSLKRKSSVLSNASANEGDASSSFIKDTPVPSKSRKGRNSETASRGNQPSSPQQNSQTGRVTRRTATAVLVSPSRVEDEPTADDRAEETVKASIAEQLDQTPGSAAGVEERAKLTPRSILGRLRAALSDFVGMKVNATEAREFDNVLYEFRREAHEADRRGREAGQ